MARPIDPIGRSGRSGRSRAHRDQEQGVVKLDPGVAVVTGGASGIGAATCALLQDHGVRVASLDHADGGPADLRLVCDVADEAALDDAYERVIVELGTPRYVFANAGVSGLAPLLRLDTGEWDRVMGIDLRAVFLTIRRAARAMVAAQQPGAIVVTSSAAGRVADVGFAHYSVAKAALRQLVRVSARELGPHGIRVNGVAPGFTLTGMTAAAADLPDFLADKVSRVPLGRVGRPIDVASVVVALFGLDWVTGETISADGGQSLSGPNLLPAGDLATGP
jgi:NAD(P)-dependent dehydrogenase (short-subunit alcohol dehydrogenase family)